MHINPLNHQQRYSLSTFSIETKRKLIGKKHEGIEALDDFNVSRRLGDPRDPRWFGK